MGLFDSFKNKKDEKKKAKKPGSHGSHWDTLSDSDSELESFVIGAVKKSGQTESLERGSQRIDAYFSGGEHLRTCTVTVNGEIWTAYPFIADGIIHEVTVKGIDEWMNEMEAQIQCSLYEASVAFFDTKYFKNRDAYKPGEKYKFSLSAMAYSLSKTEPRIIEDKQGKQLSTKGMAAFFPFQQGDIDDFLFQVPVKEVTELEFENKTVYRIKAPLFRSDNGSRDVDIYIYASKNTTKGYIPASGDDVAGILWLQGYIRE